MKRIAASIAAIFLTGSLAFAVSSWNYTAIVDSNGNPILVAPATPLGYQQITSLATSTALTVPTGSTVAVIAVETANIRYRDDGTAPTASVGMPLNSGQTFLYNGSLSAFRVIAVSGSPVVNVSYYK